MHCRAFTFSHSLAAIFKQNLPWPFRSRRRPRRHRKEKPLPDLPPQPAQQQQQPPQQQQAAISRPRQLKRQHLSLRRPNPHPIAQLPVEIVALIFVLGSRDSSAFPVVVSHVCRTWRYIALRTPALWRQIILSPKEQMWKERIHRARACALDVRLMPWSKTGRGFRRYQELTPYTVQWYMHIVLPYLYRWRSLDILLTDNYPYLWRAALNGCTVPALQLEELSLVYRNNDDDHEFTLFAGHAPSLRHLTVDGIRLNWLPSLFANLTSLDYVHHGFTNRHQAVSDLVSILGVSNQLVDLRLLFPRGQQPRARSRSRQTSTRVALPRLAHLQLTVDGSDIPFELAHLVTLIDTPILSSLRLVDLGRLRQPFPSLKSFFYVYALVPTIRNISISYGWYDPKMIQPMAHSLPNLTRIGVKRFHGPEQTLHVSRRRNRGGSVNRNSGFNSTGRQSITNYRIDQVNVQYFPTDLKGQ